MDYKTFLPGAISGGLNVLLCYPLETYKTNLQLNIYKQKYLLSYYRGFVSPFIFTFIKRGTNMTFFENTNKYYNSYLSGLVTGVINSTLSCPINNIKIKLQNTPPEIYKNTGACIKTIIKNYGIKGFYHGYYINTLRDSFILGSYLGIYGKLKKTKRNEPEYCFLYSVISSFITWTLWLPLDRIKSDIQFHNNTRSCENIINFIKNKKWGLWRGYFPVLIKIIPSSACTMYVYESLKIYIN